MTLQRIEDRAEDYGHSSTGIECFMRASAFADGATWVLSELMKHDHQGVIDEVKEYLAEWLALYEENTKTIAS